jgi:hypothetical protein
MLKTVLKTSTLLRSLLEEVIPYQTPLDRYAGELVSWQTLWPHRISIIRSLTSFPLSATENKGSILLREYLRGQFIIGHRETLSDL